MKKGGGWGDVFRTSYSLLLPLSFSLCLPNVHTNCVWGLGWLLLIFMLHFVRKNTHTHAASLSLSLALSLPLRLAIPPFPWNPSGRWVWRRRKFWPAADRWQSGSPGPGHRERMFKNNFAQFREQCDGAGAGATPFMQEPEPLQSCGSGSTYRKYSKTCEYKSTIFTKLC